MNEAKAIRVAIATKDKNIMELLFQQWRKNNKKVPAALQVEYHMWINRCSTTTALHHILCTHWINQIQADMDDKLMEALNGICTKGNTNES